MKLLREEVPGVIYFKSKSNPGEEIVRKCKIKPYSGFVEAAFSNLIATHIRFMVDKEEFNYKVNTMGGRYFMENYENSPFYRRLQLEKHIPAKKSDTKKLKI